MKARKTYQRPELVELGKAERLTLGTFGCKPDGKDCKLTEEEPELGG